MSVEAGRLSLAWRDFNDIHPQIVEKFASSVRELDLSNNNISDLSPLRDFTRLETLVLDSNRLTSHSKIPPLPSLKTLWVNKNRITNLSIFIDQLVEAVPNLRFLSMMNNDACPNFFNGGSLKQYQDYRKYVISRLRNLTQLDAQPVSDRERREAIRLYGDLATSVAFEERERQREEELRVRREEEKRLRDKQETERRRQERTQKRERRKEEARRRREQDSQNTISASPPSSISTTPAQYSSSSNVTPSKKSKDPTDIVSLLLPEVDSSQALPPPSPLASSSSSSVVPTPALLPSLAPNELTDSEDWSSDGEDWDDDD